MKGARREVYLNLADEINCGICTFCKYNHSPCYGEGCEHPLSFRFDGDWAGEPGADCWGFRPCVPVAYAADITGIVLEHGWSEWMYYEKDGQLIVKGEA